MKKLNEDLQHRYICSRPVSSCPSNSRHRYFRRAKIRSKPVDRRSARSTKICRCIQRPVFTGNISERSKFRWKVLPLSRSVIQRARKLISCACVVQLLGGKYDTIGKRQIRLTGISRRETNVPQRRWRIYDRPVRCTRFDRPLNPIRALWDHAHSRMSMGSLFVFVAWRQGLPRPLLSIGHRAIRTTT